MRSLKALIEHHTQSSNVHWYCLVMTKTINMATCLKCQSWCVVKFMSWFSCFYVFCLINTPENITTEWFAHIYMEYFFNLPMYYVKLSSDIKERHFNHINVSASPSFPQRNQYLLALKEALSIYQQFIACTTMFVDFVIHPITSLAMKFHSIYLGPGACSQFSQLI